LKTSCEYINDFLICVVKGDESRGVGTSQPRGADTLVYCSGVNVTRFLPLTTGKHRLGQNPAIKGLQSSNLEARSFALARGVTPRTVRGGDCALLNPRQDDTWYKELILFDNAPESFPSELAAFSVLNFLRIMLPCCRIYDAPPKELPDAARLQAYLESLCAGAAKTPGAGAAKTPPPASGASA
jgi:hypothetical protein